MMLIDRRYIRYFDWISFGLLCILALLGSCAVLSSTYTTAQPYSLFFKKQVLGYISGFVLYGIFCSIDYRTLCRWGYFCYWTVLGMLFFTLIKGSIGMGAQRWIDLYFIKFQPSELAKLFFAPFFTYYLETQQQFPYITLHNCVPIVAMLSISFLCILKQPDLGTALIILFAGLLLLWIAGIPSWVFLLFFGLCICTAPISWHYLKPYQKNRIAVFFGYGDTHKERYHAQQAKIAIGSGGLTGKGFLQGTQNKLKFLPESHTDFIFAVIGEECGFVGAICIMLLFTFLFIHIFLGILTLKSHSAQLLATGLLLHSVLSTYINIGMVLGLLPIVGIPLPFLSYGISHTWITFASFGWINSIFMRRFYDR